MTSYENHFHGGSGHLSANYTADADRPRDRPFRCKYCARQFSLKGNMVSHERMHTRERPYSCTHCPRSFMWHSAFINHLRRHVGQLPFKCTLCTNTFVSRKSLAMHMAKSHPAEA
ncbi:protein krueppel-like [Ixodes scapularis]|uniref:protein krueppel-like n=1 Tax=Ixodes scapularis TaxID=6945 RepID=UPI001A9EDA90|nr:protein krueppel-like [Ixodes scapularis]